MAAADQPPKFYKNPTIAVLLSFFVTGLGQIYNGQIGKGVVFIVLYAISWVSMWIVVGLVTTPILWIWGMVDAHNEARRINAELARS
jgi:TM2 domain-containing membrane protein YozV